MNFVGMQFREPPWPYPRKPRLAHALEHIGASERACMHFVKDSTHLIICHLNYFHIDQRTVFVMALAPKFAGQALSYSGSLQAIHTLELCERTPSLAS